MMSRTFDAAFVDRVRRGEYQVDEHAVAEAMIRRWTPRGGRGSGAGASPRSLVLVAAQALDDDAAGADEGKPEAGGNVA